MTAESNKSVEQIQAVRLGNGHVTVTIETFIKINSTLLKFGWQLCGLDTCSGVFHYIHPAGFS